MNKQNRKFLQFNGKNIFFLSIDGQYWVALKPICDVLNVNWDRQFKNLKSDKILRDVYANQPMRDTKNRIQNMVALPEKYVYGWLFSIQSGSDALQNYKKECYELLFNHFHGSITGRIKLLETKSELLTEMKLCKNALYNNPDYNKIEHIRAELVKNGLALKKADQDKLTQIQLQMQFS
jgi:hypothetical protein